MSVAVGQLPPWCRVDDVASQPDSAASVFIDSNRCSSVDQIRHTTCWLTFTHESTDWQLSLDALYSVAGRHQHDDNRLANRAFCVAPLSTRHSVCINAIAPSTRHSSVDDLGERYANIPISASITQLLVNFTTTIRNVLLSHRRITGPYNYSCLLIYLLMSFLLINIYGSSMQKHVWTSNKQTDGRTSRQHSPPNA